MHLEFAPKNKLFLAKKNKVAAALNNIRGKKSNAGMELLPLYPVFRDQAVQ